MPLTFPQYLYYSRQFAPWELISLSCLCHPYFRLHLPLPPLLPLVTLFTSLDFRLRLQCWADALDSTSIESLDRTTGGSRRRSNCGCLASLRVRIAKDEITQTNVLRHGDTQRSVSNAPPHVFRARRSSQTTKVLVESSLLRDKVIDSDGAELALTKLSFPRTWSLARLNSLIGNGSPVLQKALKHWIVVVAVGLNEHAHNSKMRAISCIVNNVELTTELGSINGVLGACVDMKLQVFVNSGNSRDDKRVWRTIRRIYDFQAIIEKLEREVTVSVLLE